MASKVRMLKRKLARVELELKEAEQEEAEQKDATMRDLAPMKDLGVAMSAQTEDLDGQRHVSLVVNYFKENWQSARRTLRSVEADNFELDVMVRETLEEFQLAEAKVVLLSVEFSVDQEVRRKMPQNVRLLPPSAPSANDALNEILAKTVGVCPESDALVRLGVRIVDVLRELKRVPPTVALVDSGASVSQARAVLGYANSAYLAVKLISDRADELSALLEHEGREDGTGKSAKLALELRRVNRIACRDMKLFLEPFHKVAQVFADTKQPDLPKIATFWAYLIRKCMDEPPTSSAGEAQAETEKPAILSIEQILNFDGAGFGTSQAPGPSVRAAVVDLLLEWYIANVVTEHRIAVVLHPHPHLRQLRSVCRDDQLRNSVYQSIRDLVGLSRKPRSEEIDGPPEKRPRIPDSLEDTTTEEQQQDELGIYLQANFTDEQQRDILAFWSSVGESQFPRLARLARIFLASATPIPLQPPSGTTPGPREVAALLNTAVLDLSKPAGMPPNSLSEQPHQHGEQ